MALLTLISLSDHDPIAFNFHDGNRRILFEKVALGSHTESAPVKNTGAPRTKGGKRDSLCPYQIFVSGSRPVPGFSLLLGLGGL